MMVRDFHRVIGEEARAEILKREGRLAGCFVACVGGGINAIGMFHAFIGDENVKLIGVEAGGRGSALGEHAARFSGGSPGVLHGSHSYVLQDADGQIALTHSISAGLDYASVGPEHAWLHDRHRAEYTSVSDAEALGRRGEAGAHRGHYSGARIRARRRRGHSPRARRQRQDLFIVNLSGRGDKDIDIYRENLPELDAADSESNRCLSRLKTNAAPP